MGLHHFMMKHGVGSPGYAARTMAGRYLTMKKNWPDLEEYEILRRVFVDRVAAQTLFGGPQKYKECRRNPDLIDLVLRLNPDMFSLIRCAVLIEHPEFEKTNAPADRFEVLDQVIAEALADKVPEWKNEPNGPIVVDGSHFEEPDLMQMPMIWTAWHNGNHHGVFTGFGFKVSIADRDLYFDRSWKKVTIALPVDSGYVLTEANIDKESFWDDCRELITKDIGLWMLGRKYAPWQKGLPPRFTAWPIGVTSFRVELSENQHSPTPFDSYIPN
jgi:hypothetical protein